MAVLRYGVVAGKHNVGVPYLGDFKTEAGCQGACEALSNCTQYVYFFFVFFSRWFFARRCTRDSCRSLHSRGQFALCNRQGMHQRVSLCCFKSGYANEPQLSMSIS